MVAMAEIRVTMAKMMLGQGGQCSCGDGQENLMRLRHLNWGVWFQKEPTAQILRQTNLHSPKPCEGCLYSVYGLF